MSPFKAAANPPLQSLLDHARRRKLSLERAPLTGKDARRVLAWQKHQEVRQLEKCM